MKLMLVEDSAIARDVLRDLVADVPGLAISAECTDPESALRVLGKAPPDVILLDIEFQSGTGMDVLTVVTAEHPAIKVLVVSNHADSTFRQRYADAGAYSFHDKSRELRELRLALVRLAETFVLNLPLNAPSRQS